MEERTRLIQQLDHARQAMRAALADIDPQVEIYPGWTIKQVLAHITGWDDVTIYSLRAHAADQTPGTPASQGIDPYNAQSVAKRRSLSYDQTLKEWEQARDQLKAVINEMPPEKFEQPLLFPWGKTGSVEQIVAIMVEHEEEHAVEIRQLKAKGL